MQAMRLFVLAFASGVWLLQQQAALPSAQWLGGLGVGALLILALRSRFLKPASAARRVLLAAMLVSAAVALGFTWAAGFAHLRLAEELPAAIEGRDIELTGVVAALPQALERGVRFEFDVEEVIPGVPAHISLAWYRGHEESDEEASPLVPVRAGERWRFTVRLKRPHGNLNPHGFDYEAWLFERGIRATGYVRPRSAERIEAQVWRPAYAVEMLRENIRDRFRKALPDATYAGILIALAIGDQQSIDAELWQTFAHTGITHLMSISGLHVTMFAGLAYALVNWLWRRSARLPLRLPAQHAATIGGFLAAFLYCLLAGFAVPAQRTLYMLGVVAAARLWGRETAATRVLLLALLLVLLLDPWAVLAAGFWLSFGAVALLFHIGNGRLGPTHWLVEWGRAQWAVTLGMLPALLALFQQFSLVSPLANAVAIPLVSLVITPLTLVAALLPFDLPLVLAHQLLAWLMAFIEWLAELPLAVWQQPAPPAWAVLLGLLGCIWLLLPRGFPSRGVGVFLFLPLVLLPPQRPAPGELKLTVLDVGQGLAVHARTAGHDLIYDTGPQFSTDANSGNRILLPYLRAQGVQHLDGLIVTHQDMDHAGGALSLLDGLPVDWTASSMPEDHPFRQAPGHRPCFDGQAWTWDSVRFEMLHPAPADYAAAKRKSNDMSCVLKVTSAQGSVLLTGDIETVSEQALSKRHGALLRADVLLAPHHGSRTSSSAEFLAAVGAGTVIFPVGYRNRFRHPNAAVLQRYEATGARLLRSDRDGAVTLRFGVLRGLTLEREERRRYWHGR